MMKVLFTLAFMTAALCGQGVQQLLLAETSGTTSLQIGFDFRATSGYVTDPANTQFVSDATAYNGTTACVGNQSVICGWEGTANGSRDRSTSVDARLAGLVFIDNNSATPCFRVDLPSAGTYSIRLALGDDSNSQNNKLTIKDNTTVLATIGSPTVTSAAHFLDATGTDYSSTSWPGGNTAINLTFSTTILRACLGANNGDSTTNSAVAYIGIGL